MSCRPACSLPETTPLALASLSWGNDNIPLKKADSFGFEPQKRWVNLVGGTSKDRMDQYPRPVRANRRGHFQGETDAPMSGGLNLQTSRIQRQGVACQLRRFGAIEQGQGRAGERFSPVGSAPKDRWGWL